MKTRDFYLNRFIEKHRLTDINWLSSDASSRRYARVKRRKKSYILMDSPLMEKPKEFIQIDKLLRHHSLPAPKIYAKNLRHGFLLLEDFGTIAMSAKIKNKKAAEDLYILALDTLIKLQRQVTKKEISHLHSAFDFMLKENYLFIEYYVSKILNIKLSTQAKKEFKQLWERLFQQVFKMPQTLMLYDFHADNIMIKEDNTLGLLDFQDAMRGPVFYDLVSLIEDERYPLPRANRQKLIKHYLELCPVLASEKYAPWIDVVAAHRHTRVIGRFAVLAVKYNKPQYLGYIKNDWLFLKENIKNPLLKEYQQWLKKYLPKQLKAH